ncbi:MAG: hypothetical protein ABIR47_12655 [Candidatus Kapaibacterium sp.]
MRNTLALMGLMVSVAILPGSAAMAQKQAPLPKEKVDYYLGEVMIISSEGSSLGSQLSLVKRTETPADGKIIEDVIAIKEDDTTHEYITNYAVTGKQFTMNDPEGTYTGEGALEGKPAAWTSWKYTVTLKGGAGTIVGLDLLTDEGIVSKKTFLGSDGKIGVRFSSTLKPISLMTYTILRKRLLKS